MMTTQINIGQFAALAPSSDRLFAAPKNLASSFPAPRTHAVAAPLTLLALAPEECAEKETLSLLKQEYLRCLSDLASSLGPLRETIRRLLDLGASKKELREWAIASGRYSDSHIRNIVNRLLREAGRRQRARGAGRKSPAEAIKILDFAVKQYGPDDAGRFLLAAHHAWRVRIESGKFQPQAA